MYITYCDMLYRYINVLYTYKAHSILLFITDSAQYIDCTTFDCICYSFEHKQSRTLINNYTFHPR